MKMIDYEYDMSEGNARLYIKFEEFGPGNDGGEIVFNFTEEGLIVDVTDLRGDIVGTRCEEYEDIYFDCMGDVE